MRVSIFMVLLTVSLNAFNIPSSIYKSHYNITPNSNYKIFQELQKAKELYQLGKKDDSAKIVINILQKASRSDANQNIEQYDYLLSNMILLDILKDKKDTKHYKLLAKKLLSFLDKNTNKGDDIWEDGELGKLQLSIYKTLLNNYAKILYKESKRDDERLLKKALLFANIAQKFIRDENDNYLKDTKMIIKNAIDKNPPLPIEKEVKIIKHIDKKDDNLTKKAL